MINFNRKLRSSTTRYRNTEQQTNRERGMYVMCNTTKTSAASTENTAHTAVIINVVTIVTTITVTTAAIDAVIVNGVTIVTAATTTIFAPSALSSSTSPLLQSSPPPISLSSLDS
jgi:hypothetical protein